MSPLWELLTGIILLLWRVSFCLAASLILAVMRPLHFASGSVLFRCERLRCVYDVIGQRKRGSAVQ